MEECMCVHVYVCVCVLVRQTAIALGEHLRGGFAILWHIAHRARQQLRHDNRALAFRRLAVCVGDLKKKTR